MVQTPFPKIDSNMVTDTPIIYFDKCQLYGNYFKTSFCLLIKTSWGQSQSFIEAKVYNMAASLYFSRKFTFQNQKSALFHDWFLTKLCHLVFPLYHSYPWYLKLKYFISFLQSAFFFLFQLTRYTLAPLQFTFYEDKFSASISLKIFLKVLKSNC